MDKMREEFSKHCKQWRYRDEVDENDFFVSATTQRAWDVWVTAWQASRQALVVKLPPVFDASSYDATYYECDATYYEYAYKQADIYAALDNAGVKWTE